MDTNSFGQIVPGKTPRWGKPVLQMRVLLIFNESIIEI